MSTNSTEDLLRATLAEKAAEGAVDLTFSEIRDAGARRRGQIRRRRVGYLAAAVVAVVAAPAGVLVLAGRDHAGPPTPATTTSITPTPTPSGTSTPSPTLAGLDAVRRGADAKVTYLHDGVVHQPDGSTSRLPQAAQDVVDFTPYHGGWIVLDSAGGLVLYDNTGSVAERSDSGEPALAVSADQLSTAYQVGDHIKIGISTGMGDGTTSLPIPNGARLVGFVGGDRVVYDSPSGVVVRDPAGASTTLSGLSGADATSAGDDLVGGTAKDGTSGRVVSSSTGKTLWTSSWQPRAFSPDGRYVVAVLAPDSEATDVAILDGRSGSLVSRVSLADLGVSQLGRPIWEDSDGAALIGVEDAHGQALLRLDTAGRVTRATNIVPAADAPAWIFAAQP